MRKYNHDILSRRDFTLGCIGTLSLWPLGLNNVNAGEYDNWRKWQKKQVAQRLKNYEAALGSYINGADLRAGKIRIRMPDTAENSLLVPLSVSVDAKADEVVSLFLLAPYNDIPEIGTFVFSGDNVQTYLKTRIRAERTQKIVAVVKMKKGVFYWGQQFVRVATSCDFCEIDQVKE